MNNEIKYRIQTSDFRFKFAGTGENSWFDLQTARQKIDYSKNERIVEICKHTNEILWEVF